MIVPVRVYFCHGVVELQVPAKTKREAQRQALAVVKAGKVEGTFFNRHGQPIQSEIDLLPCQPLSPWVAVVAGSEELVQPHA